MSRFGVRKGSLVSVRSSIMLQWQRTAEVCAGTDPDEITVMDCDIAIYQTVDADADSDGPGSNRGRTHPPTSDINIGASQPKRRQELTDADVDRILSKPFGGAQSLRDANMPWS